MWKVVLLAATVTAVAAAVQTAGANRGGVSWLEHMLAVLQQDTKTETGTCGDKCYLKNKTITHILDHGERIIDPNDKCYRYTCEASGMTHHRIACDDIDICEDGEAPVLLPGKCCLKCVGSFGPPGKFEEWGEWTECSKTCGVGKHARKRTCHLDEDGVYMNCTGELLQIENCFVQNCSVDCKWVWGEYSDCSATCGGGTKTRYPIITQHPQFGGKPCPPFVINNVSESMECNTEPCPKDCKWKWGEYSECSATCGGGTKTRYPIIIQYPEPGGKECPDFVTKNISQSEDCNTNPCPECDPEKPCECDKDNDGIPDCEDNCPDKPNPDQEDFDRDGVGDVCDNCPRSSNPGQENNDGDETGDKCDPDDDNDFTLDSYDNCPKKWNIDQLDRDDDGLGDACDNCVYKANYVHGCDDCNNQLDSDGDGVGDACEKKTKYEPNDRDGDGHLDGFDNCKYFENKDQKDIDRDRQGDTCDNCPNHFNPEQADRDGDDVGDVCDNCPYHWNEDQADDDGDCIGDVCDTGGVSDKDGDTIPDKCDNCPDHSNPDQKDSDGDGWGDECDSCPEIYLPFQYAKLCSPKHGDQPVPEVPQERKQNLISKIMEKLLDLYYGN